ncbi:putative DNase family Scn1 [Lyophyllum shimeji]|uniref:DNase family Scn1 n=1 Tax=Lyophyllum shimeji TaxID=47721 RepID=A0A9P3PI14_LYOSH|nr:putative DNase family Scn1 [Lyophyllum shimeji]
MPDLPPPNVLEHIVDVHCHPTDAPSISLESMARLHITICAMSTMESDQQRVRDLALAHPTKVVPCFGYHPWFTYQISIHPHSSKDDHYRRLFLQAASPSSDHVAILEKLLPSLPEPTPLADILSDLRRNLEAFPEAMLGEVGLDRVFRVPFDYYAGPRQLTPFVVPLDHQLAILEAQLDLAAELGRNVSFHSVKSQLATVDLLARMQTKHRERWSHINIDLHSCGMSPQTWRDIEKRHPNVYLSLSTVINSRSPNHRALIAACSPDRLLVESDYNNVDRCAEQTWDMIKTVADVRGWPLETEWIDGLEEKDWGTVRRLEKNWHAFKAGNMSTSSTSRRSREK